MPIFKLLQASLDEAKIRMALLDYDDGVQQAVQWVDFLSRIEAYTLSLVWFPKSRYKREIRAFLQSGYDYSVAAEQCGVTEKWLYKVMLQAELVLERRFRGVLEALKHGNLYEAEYEFHTAAGENDSLFLNVLAKHYKPVRHGHLHLNTCFDELDFLRTLCEVEDTMTRLDRDKVEHLLYILFGHDDRDKVAAAHLYHCLDGQRDVAETLDVIEPHERSSRPIISGEEG